MTRRFTVIQGGLPGAVRTVQPGRARLEAVGAALRRRLAALSQPEPAPRIGREGLAPVRRPIPAGAFVGVRPEGWVQSAA